MRFLSVVAVATLLLFAAPLPNSQAMPSAATESVVSVLPVWQGRPQAALGPGRSTAPEGSGVVIDQHHIVTAWHVIEPAGSIDVRLHDNRVLPARLVARDPASDIALLSVEETLTPIQRRATIDPAEEVCGIGNAYGLGLSITCGVVSSTGVTNAGFNALEDFLQTDAAINPGMSGGALVDRDGRFVGMISAIFASEADSNIGINFAVSEALVFRVADALRAEGKVSYLTPGWRLRPADRDQLKRLAAPMVMNVLEGGPADRAGLKAGDIVLQVGSRRLFTPRDGIAAFGLLPSDTPSVDVTIERDGARQTLPLVFGERSAPVAAQSPQGDCPFSEAICQVRQAVFPVRAHTPLASATRIAERLLVTNRHVLGDNLKAFILTPTGELEATVVPSAYPGDLVLLDVPGLPANGYIPAIDQASLIPDASFHVVGADVARREIRVFRPGTLIAQPAEGAVLGMVHVTAYMQPGTSGGALVDGQGVLKGIAAGGGDGRFRAIPVADVQGLLAKRQDPDAQAIQIRLGQAYVACERGLEKAAPDAGSPADLAKVCSEANSHGQLIGAGRHFARLGQFEEAIGLHSQAVEQVPHSINARLSLLVSLQLGGRFEEMVPHARWVMERVPEDTGALRYAIQSGTWGGAPEMAEQAYSLMLKANPQQAQAARRFIDNAPPPPPRR